MSVVPFTPVFHRFGPVPRSEIRAAVRARATTPPLQAPTAIEVADTTPDSNTLKQRLQTLIEQVTLAANDARVER